MPGLPHHDTPYHLGIAVADKAAVVLACELAMAAGLTVNERNDQS